MTKSKAQRTKQAAKSATVTLANEVNALQGDPNFMMTLGRGLAVLGAFGTAKRKLNVAEISKLTGIPPQAVRRCLYTFLKLGFLGQTAGWYTPRPRLLSLGYVFFTSLPFANLARPVLEELHQQLGLAFSIGVFDDDEVTYLVRTGGGQEFDNLSRSRPDSGVPDRRPAYCTAPGRVLLAGLPSAQFETYMQRCELKPLTERTVTSPHIFRAVIQHIRDTGFAVVDQEAAMGLRSIALPIKNDVGEIIGALGGLAVAAQWSVVDLEQKALPAMKQAVRALSLSW